MNDRVLRNIIVGMCKKGDGVMRQDGFVITVASEIMAILCLATDIKDLQERLSRIIVAYNVDNEPVTAGELKCVGAMTALLKDAIKPNLIQTLEHTPALVHGGPFANIAHGCNSVRATQTALKIADYVITEAGFGADLGAEKFFDIKCRMTGLKPDAVVLVATVRALKYNGGVAKADLGEENLEALEKGIVNLEKHIENLQLYGVPVVVTLNRFVSDTDAELAFVREFCEKRGCDFALANVWEKGGEGGIEDDGSVSVGDYDMVPLIDRFVEEHPDFSYRGAKGIVALTGYNGILGYRTDISYETRPADLDDNKVEWLDAHPDFSLDKEREEAKKVADAMKEDGWLFASHTWGHQNIGQISLEQLQADTQKFKDNVDPLIGGTDIIIFAFGTDLTTQEDYSGDKFEYLKSVGYNYYCNVDSSKYFVQIRDRYFRQGRRNLDGYRMYYNPDLLEDLFNAKDVFDPSRPTPVPPMG